MANQEQLEILKSGVENWNRWREEDLEVGIDLNNAELQGFNLEGAKLILVNLKEADLRKANLRGADLRGADLSNAKLQLTDLREIDLSEANLIKADLSETNLVGAKLIGIKLSEAKLMGINFNSAILVCADLRGADLRGADLRMVNLSHAYLSHSNLSEVRLNDADLSWADLRWADLSESDLNDANFDCGYIGHTRFTNVDLSNVNNLDKCQHIGNSFIDYLTLEKSKNLPINFLRGCGLSEKYIKGYQDLITDDSYFKCFISYSSKDHEFANKLYNDLQDRGIRVWFAPEDMKIAAKIRSTIHEAISTNDKSLLLLSKDSINSMWVEEEVEKTLEQERTREETVLFPIRLDNTIFATETAWANSIKNTRNIGDFTNWKDTTEYKKNFDKLVESLRIEN